jgi:cardiolipin synthase A/B
MNIGDEYASDPAWHDVHCRVRGPAVTGLQRIFAEDWHFATGRLLEAERYYPAAQGAAGAAPAGNVPVQVVPGGPDQDDPMVEELIFSAVTGAAHRVDVISPYFVPTEPIEAALRSALLRGRQVRLLMGERVDHTIVRWAGESILPRLMAIGLAVWVHPGMVHGKVLVVDDEWATLGSTNLDARSLRLNFEVNVAFPHAPTARRVREHVDREIAAARPLRLEDLHCALPRRLLRNLAGCFAPVL